MLRAMAASNPMMARMLEDPALLARMFEPDNMRAIMQLQSAIAQLRRAGLLDALMPQAGGLGAAPG